MKEITANVDTLRVAMKATKEHTSSVVIESKTVEEMLKSKVLESDIDSQDPFYVADLGSVIRQYRQWKRLLPRVEPFYAVKCNPDIAVLSTLKCMGTGFDCASKTEIQLALDCGIDPSQIIYANPCKQASHIRFAASKGVKMMTFDNADELHKIKLHMPDAKMVLRILTDDSKSVCRFGIKFGASLALVPTLLETAKQLEIQVIGISFHVGSGCYDATAFRDAVLLAREAFDIGERMGFSFTLLDIGGGFPGESPIGLQFSEIAELLGPTIDQLFPPHIRVISEPGRYFVSSAFTLAVNIIARRVVQRDQSPTSNVTLAPGAPTPNDHPAYMYYINDGMYGSFNCITFDHVQVYPQPLVKNGVFVMNGTPGSPQFPCSIWGPTCDSIDCMGREFMMDEMNIGDWFVFPRMGAYTIAAASAL